MKTPELKCQQQQFSKMFYINICFLIYFILLCIPRVGAFSREFLHICDTFPIYNKTPKWPEACDESIFISFWMSPSKCTKLAFSF